MLFTIGLRFAKTVAVAVTIVLVAAGLHAEAATCTNGNVTIVPSPLPSSAYRTFATAEPGTKVYSYDIITVRNGKTSQDYLPIAGIRCDRDGVYVTANGVLTPYPPTVTVSSHSLRTWALVPGLAPTANEAAQIRMGRARLVRTVTAASAAAAAAAPSPTPSPSASPKPKHFL